MEHQIKMANEQMTNWLFLCNVKKTVTACSQCVLKVWRKPGTCSKKIVEFDWIKLLFKTIH